jgi:hypothetical protein
VREIDESPTAKKHEYSNKSATRERVRTPHCLLLRARCHSGADAGVAVLLSRVTGERDGAPPGGDDAPRGEAAPPDRQLICK